MCLAAAAQIQLGANSGVTHGLYTVRGKKYVVRILGVGQLTAAEQLSVLDGIAAQTGPATHITYVPCSLGIDPAKHTFGQKTTLGYCGLDIVLDRNHLVIDSLAGHHVIEVIGR